MVLAPEVRVESMPAVAVWIPVANRAGCTPVLALLYTVAV